MTDKQKIKILKQCFQETIWMAIRYANGRHTYAPHTVREQIKNFKKVFPDFELRFDRTIEKPSEEVLKGIAIPTDYLYDLFE
jgi:hypothetical protein